MTGQIAFAQTIRALDADDFRGSKLGLFFAIVLLSLWTWWFFAASIPQYATTTHFELNQNSAEADFPLTTPIRPSQPAQITTSDGQTIQAQVEKVINEPTATYVHLILLTTPAPSPQPPAPARLVIEVNRATPASMVRTALNR
jgi:hypothetical protein